MVKICQLLLDTYTALKKLAIAAKLRYNYSGSRKLVIYYS